MEFERDVMMGMYQVVGRLVKDESLHCKTTEEMHIYKTAGGMFGHKLAIDQRKTITPGKKN